MSLSSLRQLRALVASMENDVVETLNDTLDDLLNRHFPGKVVRKDLTKLVKEGANVPVYVLEYLLGSYCASNDEEVMPCKRRDDSAALRLSRR